MSRVEIFYLKDTKALLNINFFQNFYLFKIPQP